MSIKIMQEVWDHSNVSQGTLLVLLALADSADERSRECWPAVSSLARKARLSNRQVQRCIVELVESCIVVVFPNAGRSGSNLFRICPVSDWVGDKMSWGDAHVVGGVTPMSPGGVTPMSPEPSYRTVNEPSLRAHDESDLFSAQELPKQEVQRSDRFEEFWKVYPRKVGKPAAKKNFARAIKAGADPQDIIDGARRYAASKSVADGFVKHPQGWLTDERWTDDTEPADRSRHRVSQPFGEVVR